MPDYIHDEWCASRDWPEAPGPCNCYVAVIRRREARIEALWTYCRIIYYPPATDATGWPQPYPIEHNTAAGKNGREAIEAALAAEEEKP